MHTHFSSDIFINDDPHLVVCNPDFTQLDQLYAGRTACFGDFHAHSASGGNSDGKTTPEAWLAAMDELQMDFVGVMDHRQVRHMFLECFDPARLLYGTEPAGSWNEPNLSFHYLMIVPEKECLLRVLEAFPDVFAFTGGEEGTFSYLSIERSRFTELVRAVQAEGGAVVHAHPKQIMKSSNPHDFWFTDGMVMETIYTHHFPTILNDETVANYKLWMEMLALGYRIVNTATNDCHAEPMNLALNTVYSAQKHGKAYLEALRKGDLNAGFLGIQMSLESYAVGSTAKYVPGSKLYLKLADVHPAHDRAGETYRLEILTDRGLAYRQTLTLPFAVAVEVQPRAFYRAVVFRESDGAPAAIGNPIWLE